MQEQMQGNAVVGTVTADAHFHMQFADAAYFHYFGDDAVYSILRSVHSEDEARLVAEAEALALALLAVVVVGVLL